MFFHTIGYDTDLKAAFKMMKYNIKIIESVLFGRMSILS